MEQESLDKAAELAKVYSMPGEWITFENGNVNIKLAVHFGSGRISAERIPLLLNRSYKGLKFKDIIRELALSGWTVKERKRW